MYPVYCVTYLSGSDRRREEQLLGSSFLPTSCKGFTVRVFLAASVIQPVRPLHEEHVRRRPTEHAPDVPPEVERPLIQSPFTPLLPDDEERRAGTILPAQDVRRSERAVVEIRVG